MQRVVDGYVSSTYGPRNDPFLGKPRFHSGIDIAAPKGTLVHAAGPGIVRFAGRQGGYGELVVVDHGSGVSTYYAHNSRLLVQAGEEVGGGAPLAEVGSTGESTGSHLHFEVRRWQSPIDPAHFSFDSLQPAEPPLPGAAGAATDGHPTVAVRDRDRQSQGMSRRAASTPVEDFARHSGGRDRPGEPGEPA